MTNYFGLIIGLFLTIILGNLVISFIDQQKKLALAEYLALSFLIGIGTIGLVVFFSFFFAIPNRVWLLGGLIFVGWIARFWLANEKIRYLGALKYPNTIQWSWKTLIWLLLISAVIITFTHTFVETCSKPEYSWDTCGHWTAPAKYLYFFEKVSPQNTYKLIVSLGGNSYYPKQLTTMHYWLFSWMGQANDQWSKIFFPLTLLCFTIVFFSSLKRIKGPLESLFFTVVLLSSPFIVYLSTIGYADLSVGIYFSTGIIFFDRWFREKDNTCFIVFAIFMALTTCIKLEGKLFYLLGLALLIFYLWREYQSSTKDKINKVVQYILAFFAIGLPWQLFIKLNDIHTREQLLNHLSHYVDLNIKLFNEIYYQGTWGVVWYLFLVTILIFWSKLLAKNNRYLFLSAGLFYGLFIFIFLFTGDSWESIEVTINRVIVSIFPIIVYLLAVVTPGANELNLWIRGHK